MRPIPDWVVEKEDVSGMYLVLKVVGHCPQGGHQRAEVNRNILSLQAHLAFAIK